MSDRFDILRRIIVENKFTKILELGVYQCERSSLMIAAALENSKPEDVTFQGFDMFEDMTAELTKHEVSRPAGPWSVMQCSAYLSAKFPGVHYILTKGDSKKTLETENVIDWDLCFIDGGHSLETAMSDWKHISRMMRPGKVVCFDDYSMVSTLINTRRVVDEIDRSKFDVEISVECDYASTDYESADLHLATVRMK
jgi:hypothetical protein